MKESQDLWFEDLCLDGFEPQGKYSIEMYFYVYLFYYGAKDKALD